jgi:hypothetical protein
MPGVAQWNSECRFRLVRGRRCNWPRRRLKATVSPTGDLVPDGVVSLQCSCRFLSQSAEFVNQNLQVVPGESPVPAPLSDSVYFSPFFEFLSSSVVFLSCSNHFSPGESSDIPSEKRHYKFLSRTILLPQQRRERPALQDPIKLSIGQSTLSIKQLESHPLGHGTASAAREPLPYSASARKGQLVSQ